MEYGDIITALRGLTEGVPYPTANMANAAALLYGALERINWAGFYTMEDGQLVLGPFQGKPACITIPLGRGVCGKAAADDRTMIVENVLEFPGHIACDEASRSEAVVPLHKEGRVIGVLDVDSAEFSRFGAGEKALLEEFALIIESSI